MIRRSGVNESEDLGLVASYTKLCKVQGTIKVFFEDRSFFCKCIEKSASLASSVHKTGRHAKVKHDQA